MPKRDLSMADVIRNCFATYGMCVLWSILALSAIGAVVKAFDPTATIPFTTLSITAFWLGKGLDLLRDAHPSIYATMSQSAMLTVFMRIVFAPFVEEFLFRHFPLVLAKNLEWTQIRAIIIAVSGILFGVMHGHMLLILNQGVIGVALGYLYVRNHRSEGISYLSCVAVHMALNFTVLMAQSVS